MISFFKKSCDGGKNSGVTGYWLIEWKEVFSIVVLKFKPNYRENYHSHAFNAITWWVYGEAVEEFKDSESITWHPSFIPKFTPRSNMHRYYVPRTSLAISLRGSWIDRWKEYNPNTQEDIILTHGRKIVK